MLAISIHRSAAENDAIFINIVGPLSIFLICYFYIKGLNKRKEVDDVGVYFIQIRAKIFAYLFGVIAFVGFLIGVYKVIKLWSN